MPSRLGRQGPLNAPQDRPVLASAPGICSSHSAPLSLNQRSTHAAPLSTAAHALRTAATVNPVHLRCLFGHRGPLSERPRLRSDFNRGEPRQMIFVKRRARLSCKRQPEL